MMIKPEKYARLGVQMPRGIMLWGARYAGKERFGKLLEKLDCGHLTYVEEYWQADNNSLSTGRFEFDFLRQEFYLDKFESGSGISDGKRGKIPAGAVKNFLEAVSGCCELPDSEYFEKNNTDKGPVRHRAEMFNKCFIWYTAEEPLFEKLEQAFRDLLGALKTVFFFLICTCKADIIKLKRENKSAF